jgi:hypothetical protein
MKKNPDEFCEDCDLAQATIEEMESMIVSYQQAIRTAYYWSHKPETWRQTRDILQNQIFEMEKL